MSLPRDIYLYIGTFLPLSAQSKYHQVCKMFREFPIDIEQCSTEPSNYEVATCIFNQSKLLYNEDEAACSIFKDQKVRMIIFEFKSQSCYHKLVCLKLISKKIRGYIRTVDKNDCAQVKKIELNTFENILAFIDDAKLLLYFAQFTNIINNWILVRHILSLRTNCILYGMLKQSSLERIMSIDYCYINLLTKSSPIFDSDYLCDCLSYLNSFIALLTSSARLRFEKELVHTFAIPFEINFFGYFGHIPLFKLNPQHLTQWLKRSISQLQPTDLANYEQIIYDI